MRNELRRLPDCFLYERMHTHMLELSLALRAFRFPTNPEAVGRFQRPKVASCCEEESVPLVAIN